MSKSSAARRWFFERFKKRVGGFFVEVVGVFDDADLRALRVGLRAICALEFAHRGDRQFVFIFWRAEIKHVRMRFRFDLRSRRALVARGHFRRRILAQKRLRQFACEQPLTDAVRPDEQIALP